ncbi:MAG: hypothetical protein M0Q38_14555 [Bacteroidales bacterium]|jgi:hypothetical protein|nr:hypothetical protein [Bacteroidales bacterium]
MSNNISFVALEKDFGFSITVNKYISIQDKNTIIGRFKKCLKFYFTFLNLYILIEKGTTFQLKSIPLIEVKPVALQTQKQHKNDDKHGYKTRDCPKVLPGV